MRFEVHYNGSKLCTAGVDDYGVVSVDLHHMRRRPWEVPDLDEIPLEEAELQVGGLDSNTEERLRWVERPISAGDEIVVKVLPAGDSDQAAATRLRGKAQEKEFKGTKIILRAANRDDRRKGWAVVVPDFSDKTITTILMKSVDLENLARRESAVGDITIHYTPTDDGRTTTNTRCCIEFPRRPDRYRTNTASKLIPAPHQSQSAVPGERSFPAAETCTLPLRARRVPLSAARGGRPA